MEALPHRIGIRLRAGQRLHCSPLADLRGARFGVRDPAGKYRCQYRVGRETDAPAGHRIGLGGAIADDRALAHARQRCDRHELAVVDELAVDLVGVDPDAGMSAQHVGNRFERRTVEDSAGRIVRRIEDQQPCLRTDPRRELGRIEREAARLAQWQRHRHRAVGDDLRLVDREARDREDHLVAGAVVGDRGDRVADERLRAGADDDLVGADLDAAQRAHRCRGGRTQFVDAC